MLSSDRWWRLSGITPFCYIFNRFLIRVYFYDEPTIFRFVDAHCDQEKPSTLIELPFTLWAIAVARGVQAHLKQELHFHYAWGSAWLYVGLKKYVYILILLNFVWMVFLLASNQFFVCLVQCLSQATKHKEKYTCISIWTPHLKKMCLKVMAFKMLIKLKRKFYSSYKLATLMLGSLLL